MEITTASVTSTVMIVLSTIFTIIIAIAAIVGFSRRWKRSTVGLCRIILAVIISAIIVAVMGSSINFSENVAEFVNNEIQGAADAPSQTALWLLISCLYSLAVPFFFVFVFVIVAQILRIPAYFISKALHITKEDELERQNTVPTATDTPEYATVPQKSKGITVLEKIGGALISAVCALIVICVCILPITGLVCTLADGLTEFSESAKDSDAIITIDKDSVGEITVDGQTIVDKEGRIYAEALNATMKTSVAPVRNNFYVAMSYSAPMKLIYDNITKVRVGDSVVSFSSEIKSFFELASNSVCFITDFEKYGEKQIAAADKLADYIINSKIHCEIAAEIFSSIAKSIEKPADNEFVAALIETLEKTTPESVAEDVITARDIFKSAVRNNLPKSLSKAAEKEDGYIDVIESINSDFVYDFLSAIKKNKTFSELVTPALNYAAEMIAKSFNSESLQIQVGTDLKDLSDEQLREEAKNIALALADAKDTIIAMNSAQGNNNLEMLLNADVAPIGAFIDHLEDSLLIGDGAKDLLLMVLRSEKLSENGLDEIFEVIAEHVERGENVSMEKVLVSTKEIVKVINDYQGGNETAEGLSESLKTIVENLDPETAAITIEIIPKVDARMIDGGEGADESVTQNLMTSFVETLSSKEAKELVSDNEKFKKEVAAFDCLLNLINSITSGNGYNLENIDGMIETLATSKLVTTAVVSAAYDKNGNLTAGAKLINDNITEAEKQSVVSACENYYNAHKSGYSEKELAQIKTNLTAIASIFGEDIVSKVATW